MRQDYERQHRAAFFDEYAEQEWTRFDEGRTPPQSVAVHLAKLREFARVGDRVLDGEHILAVVRKP